MSSLDSEKSGSRESAANLSVDQLSQAFAQLMGERQEDVSAAPSAPAELTDAGEETDTTEPPVSVPLDEDPSALVSPESIVEAMLFIGHPENRPLSGRMMAGYLRGVSPQEVDEMIVELNGAYRQQGSPYEIVSEDGGYRMSLRPEFHRLRDTFLGRVREARLTQAAIDILAVVAYHQPITQDKVDTLRGQPSGATLSQLVRRQLLQVEYTTEKPRKKVYRTTDRFLDLMGLDCLEDLPSQEDF